MGGLLSDVRCPMSSGSVGPIAPPRVMIMLTLQSRHVARARIGSACMPNPSRRHDIQKLDVRVFVGGPAQVEFAVG